VSQAPNLRDSLRVTPGGHIDLGEVDPGATFGFDKEGAKVVTDGLLDRLTDLQERLWAEGRRSVLIVLQGIDAAGKDGTIRKVMTAFNPQGCPVASFKVPSAEELAHDFLWRIHRRVPGKGEVGIFNRSHYEDVLVVRVHELVPKDVWMARYDQIVAFEDHLTANGTTIVKFFLYIDKDEQLERFRARHEDPTKRWKFALGDLEERKRWDDYIAAYEDALSKTSTSSAPWYVIPANKKWFRDLAVASIVGDTLQELDPQYPKPVDLPEGLVIE
jgi:PPK2 family polyphosphate:nucleotide phosphotransferase